MDSILLGGRGVHGRCPAERAVPRAGPDGKKATRGDLRAAVAEASPSTLLHHLLGLGRPASLGWNRP
ncbi:MAG: hypothetical protein LBT98_02035 [Puniceicoccales bacterium]|nr:hypothetical protein [Puniceicoccales bacterium]